MNLQIGTGGHVMNNSLIIKNARLIDGLGTVCEDLQCIQIKGGEISSIGRNMPEDDCRLIDAAGATVMPGLIDAHVHLQSVPGSVFRKDSDETLQKYRYHQLRAYLACGVTTVLDNAISAPMLKAFNFYKKTALRKTAPPFEKGGLGWDLLYP